MSEQLQNDATMITIQRGRGGWAIGVVGGPAAGIGVAVCKRQVLHEVALGIGMAEIPPALLPTQDNVERALLLLGSLMSQMRKHAIYVVNDGEEGKKVLDGRTTTAVAADIQSALEGCGFKFEERRPGA